MALFLVRRTRKDIANPDVEILLVSSIDKETVEKTMLAVYPNHDCEVPEETPELVEQLFNEQYGGIAIIQTI